MVIKDKDKELNDGSSQQVQQQTTPDKESTSNQQSANVEQPIANASDADTKDDEGWVAVGSGLGINE